jgi:ribosomal protein L11 methyltransferase
MKPPPPPPPRENTSVFVWSKLSAARWEDAWEERFAGNPNFVMEYLKGGRSLRLRLFCKDEREARAVVARFGGGYRKMASGEWRKPVAMPRPVKVRDAFLVTGESAAAKLRELAAEHPGRDIISIPPEMAFGTGDHATTATCLRLLVDVARGRPADRRWTCADLGTGTGLLAIAAAKLGAGEVFACDFDPFAVRAAERNAKRNGTPEITVGEQDVLRWKPRKSGYDVVVANLFSTVLIEAWPVIAKSLSPKGDLVVSGILAAQAWDVFTAAAASGLGFTTVIRKGKWVTARGGHMADLAAGA